MNKITIVDAMMGQGKTSWAIQLMNKKDNKRYIFVTPYLTEIQRIQTDVTTREFATPEAKYSKDTKTSTKLNGLKKLLEEGKDIATTHKLFKTLDDEILLLLKLQKYTLILDEVMDVVEEQQIKRDDIRTLREMKLIDVDGKGKVIWNDLEYDGAYNNIKEMSRSGILYLHNNIVFIWTFPVEVFEVINEVYILTYLFEGQLQKYYFDLYKLGYIFKSVIEVSPRVYELIDYVKPSKDNIKQLIYLYEGNLNDIGSPRTALSVSSLRGLKLNNKVAKTLRNNTANFFRHKCKGSKADNMWTTVKDAKNVLKGKGYTTGFVPMNARATNEYKDKSNLAYLVNRFLRPTTKQFFENHGVNVNEDMFALSELVQWIFRSRIREGQPINLYIPSKRMRTLLIQWLNNEF